MYLLKNIQKAVYSYLFIFKYLFIYLILTMISRLFLLNEVALNMDFSIFIFGLRMDIIIFFSLSIFPVVLNIFNSNRLIKAYFSVVLVFLTLSEISNYFFFQEFQTRLNYLVLEYIKYPNEILKMLWFSYKVPLFLTTIFLSFLLISIYIIIEFKVDFKKKFYKLLVLPFILIFLFLGIRSSFDSSTPNPSFYSHSNNAIKNDITNNSIFSLVYAIYSSSKDTKPFFGKKEFETRKSISNNIISTHKKKNHLTLVALEGFGKSYVGILGGTKTTPLFDKMTKDGLFMSNMYSSSNRSNRGFEAILSSAFPIISSTYLKLPKSQKNFWTIAYELKTKGYETIFLYGGDSKFDNMKAFALSNGFDKVVDLYNFDSSIKRFTWGVSDEAIYAKAEELLKKANQPTFLFIFTLSSHKPFDYPDNKIELYKDEPKESFANSIKYADYALNGFYNKLKELDYFKDSLFVAVADHNAHMFGSEYIPIDEFKIPAIIIGSDITKSEFKGVSHQIDLAPTLLDAMGITSNIPAQGNNLFKQKKSSALIVHRKAYAYLKDEAYVIYKKKSTKVYDLKKQEITNTLIKKEGLNKIYKTYDIYNNKLHNKSE